MKKLRWLTVVLVAWGVTGGRALQPAAQGQTGRGYFWAGAGPAWTDDADLDQFADVNVSGVELEFNTGFRFDLGGGYHFTDWLAAEFETGVIYNSLDSVNVPYDGDLSVSQVPLLANVVLTLPNRTGFVPFVGGGLGGSFSMLNAEFFEIGGAGADGSFSDFVFAWQGFGGVRYDFNENMSLSATYKYFAAESADWEPDIWIDVPPSDIQAGPFRSQSVNLAFTFRF